MIPCRTLLLLALTMATASRTLAEPVNPNATPEARKLLSFLTEIQGRYILTGQHNFATAYLGRRASRWTTRRGVR